MNPPTARSISNPVNSAARSLLFNETGILLRSHSITMVMDSVTAQCSAPPLHWTAHFSVIPNLDLLCGI